MFPSCITRSPSPPLPQTACCSMVLPCECYLIWEICFPFLFFLKSNAAISLFYWVSVIQSEVCLILHMPIDTNFIAYWTTTDIMHHIHYEYYAKMCTVGRRSPFNSLDIASFMMFWMLQLQITGICVSYGHALITIKQLHTLLLITQRRQEWLAEKLSTNSSKTVRPKRGICPQLSDSPSCVLSFLLSYVIISLTGCFRGGSNPYFFYVALDKGQHNGYYANWN